MPYASDHKQRIEAALKLLDSSSTSFDKFESIKALLTDLDPRLNKILDDCHKTISNLHKLQTGNFIELAAEHIPETDEKLKKRKKALLLFIHSWHNLKGEVVRIQKELSPHSHQSRWLRYGKIIKSAKGPFGLVTITALAIVGILLIMHNKNSSITKQPQTTIRILISPTKKPPIRVINFTSKQIPLTQLRIGQGPDCGNGVPTPHYHALNEISVQALDGTIIPDPGGCGYGKVSETSVLEIN